eukprot:10698279-Ditylum_brightwellii.AAC.2
MCKRFESALQDGSQRMHCMEDANEAKVTTAKKPSIHHFNLKLKAQQCKANNCHLILTGQEAENMIIRPSPT